MASDFFVFLPKNFPLQAWNSNNIEPAHIVTAQFSIIYKSFKKIRFQKRSHAAVENNSDKTSQISRLNSSTKLEFLVKLLTNVPHDTWRELLSTSRRTFLQKHENFFPKAYLYRREIHFRQHLPNFLNSIFRGTSFFPQNVPLHT